MDSIIIGNQNLRSIGHHDLENNVIRKP
jgi:hypothetical protein